MTAILNGSENIHEVIICSSFIFSTSAFSSLAQKRIDEPLLYIIHNAKGVYGLIYSSCTTTL